jgi:hypothetical protein
MDHEIGMLVGDPCRERCPNEQDFCTGSAGPAGSINLACAEIWCEFLLSTRLGRFAVPPARSAKGHKERFPPRRLSGRCRFSKGTFARRTGTGEMRRNWTFTPRLKGGRALNLLIIRLEWRYQQGSTHIPSGRPPHYPMRYPRKVDGFLTPFAILCARKASSESPLWLHLKSRQ